MKKSHYLLSVCSLLAFTSCSKNFDAQNEDAKGSKTVEYSIVANAPGFDTSSTKADMGAVARVYWQTGDKIDVYMIDGTSIYADKLGTLTAQGTLTDASTATFKGNLTAPAGKTLEEKTLMFVYPSSEMFTDASKAPKIVNGKFKYSLAAQSYASNGRVNFCAYATATYSSLSVSASSKDFILASSFMNAVLTDNTHTLSSISSVNISNIGTDVILGATSGTTVSVEKAAAVAGGITVNYTTAPTFSSDMAMINFAVPAVAASTRIMTIGGKTATCTKGKALDAGKFYSTPVSFSFSKEFSVSSTKKVFFSPSNLWWGKYAGSSASAAWHFEGSQYDYQSAWSTDHVSHFYWTSWTDYNSGTAAYKPYALTYSYSSQSTSDNFFCSESHQLTVDGKSGWYALSKDEWTYLLNTRTDANRFAKANVNGIIGFLIFPNGYSVTSGTGIATINKADATFPTEPIPSVTWTNMETAGVVFIPTAGVRHSGSTFQEYGSGGYVWSSSPSTASRAYMLLIQGDKVDPGGSSWRSYARSIRLVRNIN